MHIIALGQGKGGVGKSVCAINLAWQAVAAGKIAAVVDLDTEQLTAFKWGKRRNGIDRPLVLSSDAVQLPNVLAKLEADGVEFVFLDLPGRNAPTSGVGLKHSDLILVPCRPLDVDVEASATTVQAAKRGGKRYSYLMNIAPPQVNAQRARKVADVLRKAGHPVAPVIIIQRIQVPDAVAVGKSVGEFDPAGDSAAEFAKLFEWISDEVGSAK